MDLDDLDKALASFLDFVRATIHSEFASVWLLIQLGSIVLALLVALATGALVRRKVDLAAATEGWPAYLRMAARAVVQNSGVIAFVIALFVVSAGLHAAFEQPRIYLVTVAINLASAWVAINVATSIIRNQFINRVVAISAWTLAALSILQLLGPVTSSLDSIAISAGGLRISLLLLLKATALLLLAVWIATVSSNFLDRRVQGFTDLTPSLQVLIGKLIRIVFLIVAILVVLSSVGIDLSVLALFTGAVGVGIGFGLQKIVSNFVSGIILLADKSIKPGDIISVGDSFGWVDAMGARYTSVVTRDGREFLIPNEDFVTQRVLNWSYSNKEVRLEVDFGVSYGSDPHRVRALAIEATQNVERILKVPPPVCHLVKFGDSSLDFKLRFWIRDPVDGITNVRSNVMLALWDAFKREGIEIPFPQRDINMRTPVQVRIEREDVAPAA